MEEIAANFELVHEQIATASQKSGRSPNDIELVAVSKTHAAEKVQAAFGAGEALFGDSRVQEARAKIPLLPSRLRWHFIGRLPKDKIRHALPLFPSMSRAARRLHSLAATLTALPSISESLSSIRG